MKYVWLVALALLASCSKSNSEACCTSEADCTAVGLPSGSTCPSGQGCSDHACIAAQCTGDSDCSAPTPVCSASLCVTCDATHGCAASDPVCSIDMSTCNGCGDDTDCTAFSGADKCDKMSGSCVQCVTAADCASATPVCDGGACRVCNADSDCASGACDVGGSCVDPITILYVSTTGADAGTCPMMSPCATLGYALTQLHSPNRDIVLAPGSYADNVTIVSGALTVGLHGGGATLIPAGTGSIAITTNTTPVLISDLALKGEVTGAAGMVSTGSGLVTLRSVSLADTGPLTINGPAAATDLSVTTPSSIGVVVNAGGNLTLDRAMIFGGLAGVACTSRTAHMELTNVLIAGAVDEGVVIEGCSGFVQFSTIADNDGGTLAQTQVDCGTGPFPITSTIIAGGPTSTTLVTGTCTFTTTIASGQTVPNTMNVDPMFVDRADSNYHISASSPAKDAVPTGPPDDFEGDARPQGPAFDIGADEAPP